MSLTFRHRKAEEAPSSTAAGKTNEDLIALKGEMAKLPAGMVLEIATDGARNVRSTKMLISKAAKELGIQWSHWNVGETVFTKPAVATRRRGRRPKAE
jgi:TusA-related sulfurtransferase